MLEFFGTVSLAPLLLWRYIIVASLHRRLAVKLTVCISDQFTEVFDNQSTSLIKIPNKIVCVLDENELRILNRSARHWDTSTLAVCSPLPGHELAGLHPDAG
jgi:hypothetical protein